MVVEKAVEMDPMKVALKAVQKAVLLVDVTVASTVDRKAVETVD
jgi:hypothetical protein